MRTKILFTILLATFTVALYAVAVWAQEAPQRSSTQPKPAAKVYGVEAVVKDPAAHAGPIAVEGVVAKVIASRGTFTIIDVREFASCGVTTCAEFTVPISVPQAEYRGTLPKEKDQVVAFGELVPLDKGFRFTVGEVKQGDKAILTRIDYLPSSLLGRKAVIGLTAEQVEKLETLDKDYATERARLESGIAHCEAEMNEALEKQPPDDVKAAHEQEEVAKLRDKLVELRASVERDARAVLSPEQQKKLRN